MDLRNWLRPTLIRNRDTNWGWGEGVQTPLLQEKRYSEVYEDCHTRLNDLYCDCNKVYCGEYYAKCRKDYNIEEEHEDAMCGHKCQHFVTYNLITVENGVPKVREMEDMELHEVQKPMDLIPPPLGCEV